ncbi:TonB-dependent receptor [Sphingomonas ginsenosidivorax]|uniref:TonB-dependent receptor n=1 Tax=Sphingomonas ginsenosidivorax TaxID=862135 RepID=A0A5C6UBS9_9SPHN|nr:TonB-dependent receptor [Sphingomonas ginsenosidivorax]TXC70243.1 TonB-dependent receptor [Sphingomonas ginsenosidivorax]
MTSLLALGVIAAAQPGAAQTVANPSAPAATAPTDDLVEQGDIIVTAQRRDERARDVPISITNVTAAQLETANIQQLSDVARVTPALRFDSSGSFSQPTIRGVGTAVTTSGGGPNVGIYVDGFYVANPEATAFDLTKTQSIQVLKGPQGTLFGRNTTGGAILVTTAEPSMVTAAEFKATYGRFDAQTYQGYVTTGLGTRVAVDLEGQLRKGDGYFRNLANDDRDVGAYQNWSVRGGVKVRVTDDLSVLLRYTHSETDDPTLLLTNAYVDRNGGSGFYSRVPLAAYGTNSSAGKPLVYAFAPPATYATRPGEVVNVPGTPTRFTNQTDAFQATIRADLGFADLTSYTQVRKDDAVNLQDLDATALALFNINLGIGNRTTTQEFLFTSKPGSALQWTAGLYYFRNRDTYFVNAAFGPPPYMPFGGSSTTTRSYAAFADGTYQLSPSLFFTAGLRYGHDVVGDAYFLIPVTQARFDVPEYKTSRVTPRAVLRYKPSDVSSVYASYSRGYKAGILNVGGASAVPIRPEDIDAFEIGYKFDDRRLSFDLAAYYYRYKNLQVSSFQSGLALITNAASSHISGAEASARYKLTSTFDLTAGAAYTHARYKDFSQAPFYSYCDPTGTVAGLVCGAIGPGSITQTTNDSSGYQMQRAPDFTANAGANYHTALADGTFSLSGNLYYTSKFYFDASKQFEQTGYAVLAMRAQWTDPSDRFTLAVFGDNLTGKRYRNQVLFNTLGIGAVWNAPRTCGVTLAAKF